MNMLQGFLKTKREESGLTQQEVATRLGYSTAQFVSNWERGLSYPPIKAIPTISKLYKVDGDKIFNMLLVVAVDLTEKSMKEEYRRMKRVRYVRPS